MELNNLKITSKNIFLFWIFFLILPNISALIISEIMYDLSGSDSGREWIEIYNDESIALNLTGWKFFEGGTSHLLSLISGSFILNPGDYAIISENDAQFLLDNPGFSGVALFDSSFSLSNSGETLAIKNNSLEIINSITYSSNDGANGDGNSLQICDGIWKGTSPTPGSANICQTQTPQMQNQTQTQTQNNQNNNLSSAKPVIEVAYPKNASLNQEFNFKIKLMNFAQGIYDIKIDILSNGTRIANILNDGQWKSTNYYLIDAINQNEEKEFSIKIIEKFENAEITIKIKDSAEKIEIFQGYFLYKGDEISETKNETTPETIYLNAPPTNAGDLNENKENQTPVLDEDSKDIKSEENKAKLDKSNYARYILTAFVFLLVLLFLLKKIFKKRYQNEFKS